VPRAALLLAARAEGERSQCRAQRDFNADEKTLLAQNASSGMKAWPWSSAASFLQGKRSPVRLVPMDGPIVWEHQLSRPTRRVDVKIALRAPPIRC
jgi:hypothetical protein